MTTATIPIASVRVGARQRPLNGAKVAELAASIAELGLLQPIGVRPDGTLVYGYHRLEACKRLGWTEIPAVIVDTDDLHAELAELDENLVRNEFTVLQRSKLLLKRKQFYEQLYPDAKPEVQRLRGLKQFQDTDSDNDFRDEIISSRERLVLSVPETPTFVEDTARRRVQNAIKGGEQP